MRKKALPLLGICLALATLTAWVAGVSGQGTAAAGGADNFGDPARWSAFDAGDVGGRQTRGYFGADFDGRYIYFAPCRTRDFHGCVLRYDTRRNFESKDAWESYDAAGTDGLDTRGYSSVVCAGGCVYFVPFACAGGRHARVLRYDGSGSFGSPSSWSAFDARSVAGKRAMGYVGGVFDGRYIYFVPFGFRPYAHGIVIRYDTKSGFESPSSWTSYDAGSTDGLTTKGFYGGGFDGRHVYFVPFNDGTTFHGRVLRYDTKGEFISSSSWSAYDAGRTDGLTTTGYKGAAFDGRFIYFVPFRDGANVHGKVLRYDTTGQLKAPSSWSAYDAGRTGGLDTRGYVGAVYDGRYLVFTPYSSDDAMDFHARFLRYDTLGDLKAQSSWAACDKSSVDGMDTRGYKFSAFDGKYIYFAPYHNGRMPSGIVLRYDTRRK